MSGRIVRVRIRAVPVALVVAAAVVAGVACKEPAGGPETCGVVDPATGQVRFCGTGEYCACTTNQCATAVARSVCPSEYAYADGSCVPAGTEMRPSTPSWHERCGETAPCDSDGNCDDANPCNGLETCDETSHLCVAGTASSDGVPCTTVAGTASTCVGGWCPPPTCGNGAADPEEQCDDGNEDNGDGCLDSCRTASCGDGFLWAGSEQCDDGNRVDTDACPTTCRNAACGDGYVQAGVEECDGAGPESCATTCGSEGFRSCSACRWGACLPGAETCNGIDDDCFGGPDDRYPCVQSAADVPCTTSCGSAGTGRCRDDCTLPPAEECTPPAEVGCNATDDDCDTSIDEDDECVPGNEGGECPTTCGTRGTEVCGGDCTFSICVPPADTCNGDDDNCDTMTDEGFPCARGQAVACTTTCGSAGSVRCSDDCENPLEEGDVEVECADDIDNDGDGRTDCWEWSCTTRPACTCDPVCEPWQFCIDGECREVYECVPPCGPSFVCSYGVCVPGGGDGDADGDGDGDADAEAADTAADDAWDGADVDGGDTSPGDADAAADLADDGHGGPTVVCDPPEETCNGTDDDCDGAADEDFECVAGTYGAPCATICGSTGQRECTGACTWGACHTGWEACNAEDDDCDGETDEDFDCVRGTSVACTTSCGTTGTAVCNDSCYVQLEEWMCWEGYLEYCCAPPTETCNAADDDCDGVTDETFACVHGTATTCTTTCGSIGTGSCSATCTPPPVSACTIPDEMCTGTDDDCDRQTDEACPCAGDWIRMWPPGEPYALNDVWVASATDVFAVGAHGTIAYYDGTWWRSLASGTTEDLYAVWGSSPTNMLAVGANGTILRFDGSAWIGIASGTTAALRDVWGSSAIDVFVVGDATGAEPSWWCWGGGSCDDTACTTCCADYYGTSGTCASGACYCGDVPESTVLRFDGAAWSPVSVPFIGNLTAMWGSAPDDVFAVGPGGTILHFGGTSWTTMTSGTTEDLYGVWGSSDADVYAVGANGTIRHYDGSGWGRVASGTTASLSRIWGTSASEIFLVTDGGLSRYDGSSWAGMSAPIGGLAGIHGMSSTDIYAVGSGGTILHHDGASWTIENQGVGSIPALAGASATGAFALWGGCYEYQGLGRYDGRRWDVESFGWTPCLVDLWVASASVAYFADRDGYVLRWAGGGTYDFVEVGRGVYGIWGSSPSDVFAVGDYGTIVHYDGASWSTITSGTLEHLRDVGGTAANNVFAVGEYGTVRRWDGASWSGMTSGTSEHLNAVFALSRFFAVAVGENGAVVRYSSDTWSAISPGTAANLQGVWATSPSNIFVVGDGGTALRYNGTSWSDVPVETTNNLYDVWGPNANMVFIVGDGGTILQRCGSGW